ncbi:unnamed protein product [Cylicocyclus nassatus]|uniref:Apple domain-containing protein n=1 Tax=Cylicocyclus nassatus TaxID=53992 RepID=A0AA36GZW0_CYLNA|nr:unnamed protein product [Cylicocyclus nassatus]
MVSPITEVSILLLLAKSTSNTGVFRFDPEAKHGNSIYFLYLEKQSQCLRACYDESECKVVEYNETDGFCRLYREGKVGPIKGYELKRDETDSSCMTETSTSDVAFQRIPPRQEDDRDFTCKDLAAPDKTVIVPFERERYRFFFSNTSRTSSKWTTVGPRLSLSKKAEETCTPVPVFHKANHRRLFFGEIYNTTGYYFFNGYAFADSCVVKGECLGVWEIQEYEDEDGKFYYDKPGRDDLKRSDLDQIFYIAKIAKSPR